MAQEAIEIRQKELLEFLERGAFNSTQIANHFNLSREHASRFLIYPLRDSKLISKVEGTNKWQKTGQQVSINEIKKQLASVSEFNECKVIQNMIKATTSESKFTFIAAIRRICMGKTFKGYEINPDAISFPQDIEKIIELYQKHKKVTRLPYMWRQAIRALIRNGLRLQVSDAEYIRLGLDGEKNEPIVSDLHIEPEQYEKAKEILQNNPRKLAQFVFGCWTGVRPSVTYTIKCDALKFYDRKVRYIDIDGKKITDIDVIEKLKSKFEVKIYTHRACSLTVYEFKTSKDEKLGKPFPKFIYNDEDAKILEDYTTKRIHQGYTYLFWDDNKTEFDRKNYIKIALTKLPQDNEHLKQLFISIGFKKSDFGKNFKANYGLRHFAIQKWCQLMNYDYSKIKKMFHEDEATLEKWYGKMTQAHFEKTMDEILPI